MDNRIKRILAAIIDFYIICFLSAFFICIITLGKFDVSPLTITIYLIFSFLTLLIKDFIFKNASIGKRIFKLKVMKTDNTKVTILDVIKRTLPIVVLLPIEVFLLIFNDRRIGDIWAKTLVNSNTGDGNCPDGR